MKLLYDHDCIQWSFSSWITSFFSWILIFCLLELIIVLNMVLICIKASKWCFCYTIMWIQKPFPMVWLHLCQTDNLISSDPWGTRLIIFIRFSVSSIIFSLDTWIIKKLLISSKQKSRRVLCIMCLTKTALLTIMGCILFQLSCFYGPSW